MLGGAVAVLLLGEIGPMDALSSINPDVMLFLFGMFVVGEAIHRSGALLPFSYTLFRRAMNVDALVILLILILGILSAILMNDTIAIIGTPFVLSLSRKYGISTQMLLLVLAFSVTTGSVLSPIGNPQNLLIALASEMENPFVTFAVFLALPTLVGLGLIYFIIRLRYPGEFPKCTLSHEPEVHADAHLSRLSYAALLIAVVLIGIKVAAALLDLGFELPLTAIALAAAAPLILLSTRRIEILRNIDWRTLIFFAALFVLMQSVWNTGIVQGILGSGTGMGSIPGIIILGVLASQIISNVPFVALMLPAILSAGVSEPGLAALAAGSTIAGNLLIFGAASNVIIIQNAEKEGYTIDFLEFAKAGVPLTILQAAVYTIFLAIFSWT
jgi:Na+/H+ antiporter NhaD/arsenite permease-like protein